MTSSPVTAAVTGEHHFKFVWLGREYMARVNAIAGQLIPIDGEWFNEGAAIVGTFIDPSGNVVEDSGGFSEIYVQVINRVNI